MQVLSKERIRLNAFSFLYRIGSCPKCMRQSGYATMTSLLLFVLFPNRYTFYAALFLAAVFVLHLAVFTFRTTSGGIVPERRRFLRVALGGLVIILSLPSFGGNSRAANPCQGRMNCGHSRCQSSGETCCPLGYSVLSLCDCRCYKEGSSLPKCDDLMPGLTQSEGCYDQNF